MASRILIILMFLFFSSGCIQQAQEGNVRYAMEQYGKCNFSKSLAASQEAINLGKSNVKLYILALLIKGKSLEKLGKKNEAVVVFREIVKINEHIHSVEGARAGGKSLDQLSRACEK